MLMTTAVWQRVYAAAKNLEARGRSPFTRKELIAEVRSQDPSIGDSTLGPVIQGMTANLKGGPGGAASRDLLLSVGRGLFVVHAGAALKEQQTGISQASPAVAPEPRLKVVRPLTGPEIRIGGFAFRHVKDLDLETDFNGRPVRLMPQQGYANAANLPLNKYGSGPFCRFRIPNDLPIAGVYAFVIDGDVRYIGECADFSRRFNIGYGQISPRNCFRGGQETNCRINSLVLREAEAGTKISLYFFQTAQYKEVELRLRNEMALPWNRI